MWNCSIELFLFRKCCVLYWVAFPLLFYFFILLVSDVVISLDFGWACWKNRFCFVLLNNSNYHHGHEHVKVGEISRNHYATVKRKKCTFWGNDVFYILISSSFTEPIKSERSFLPRDFSRKLYMQSLMFLNASNRYKWFMFLDQICLISIAVINWENANVVRFNTFILQGKHCSSKILHFIFYQSTERHIYV